MEKNNSWGGKRNGAGRKRKPVTDVAKDTLRAYWRQKWTERKQRTEVAGSKG